MKKVVAFLEKYAEWVAMGLACVFLLYMVYAYVVSPDDLRVTVGKDNLMPGDVDTQIQNSAAAPLEQAMQDKNDIKFLVPDFAKDFALAMSKDRERMKPEYVMGTPFRQALAPGHGPDLPPDNSKQYVDKLPIPSTPIWNGNLNGNSVVGVAAAVVQGAAAPAQPAALVATEKNWVMGELKIDVKAFADAWKVSLFNKGEAFVPAEILLTHFLKVEVERQELVDANNDTWTDPVQIEPLAIAEIKAYPKKGEREAEEEYRLWAEKHQVEIVEPPFYPVQHGDEWNVPSLKAKDKAAAAAADANKEGPFDPANPPKRELTADEKRQVYQYNKAQADAKAKAAADERKAKMNARPKAAPSSGSPSGGGGRKIGGYAPLPGQKYDDGGRPIGPAAPSRTGFDRGVPSREGRRQPGTLVNPTPTIGNNGAIQNPALQQAFDPTSLAAVDGKGDPASITLWFHDDTVTPGKTFRYHVRYMLKNPVYLTQGVTKNPEFETQLAIASPWSEWSEIKAPTNNEFFFSRAVQPINGKINSVMVDVFKREKGDWYQGSFTIAPGDSIGTIKNKMDFTSGSTLVDIRPDVREKDLKILVSDEAGNIRVISFDTQKNDPLYGTLKEKAKATAGAGPAAAAGNPALINEIGNR